MRISIFKFFLSLMAVCTLFSRLSGFALLLVERFHRIQAPSFEVAMGCVDRKICDYHDVLLRQSGVECSCTSAFNRCPRLGTAICMEFGEANPAIEIKQDMNEI